MSIKKSVLLDMYLKMKQTRIFEETAAWHRSHGVPRNTTAAAEGELNVADDGYREAASDLLTLLLRFLN